MRRRDFLNVIGRTTLGGALMTMANGCTLGTAGEDVNRRRNVVLILTDDQGYGDVGWHGNDKIETPNLDRLAAKSVELTQFYVCPVCTPTRATMMTGRYNYRTKAIDTYLGRAMMDPEEVTLGRMFQDAGYRTGIFGKWHLGDNYPMRSCDKGFDETVVHKGGGLCQPANPPEGNAYFDATLFHNGEPFRSKGYCTDVFTDAAINFIEENRERPFLVYLPTNAPHTPLRIADKYVEPYRKMGLDDTTAKVYGMITNLDENVGRLLAKLKELKLEDDTIVLFITDNGPQQGRYNAGLHGRKGTVYDGGIRVPCVVRLPGELEAGRKLDCLAGHIDVLPTLLDACRVPKTEGVKLDGRSFWPVLTGEKIDWPDRTLFFQWHRGDVPIRYCACAARSTRYKIVQSKGRRGRAPEEPVFELYDMKKDPGEKHNIAAKYPEIVEKLRKEYDAWFDDVTSTRGYDPPRIHLGTPHEDPVMLTRQDWRGPKAGWGRNSLGHWEVYVAKSGGYDVTLRFHPRKKPASAHFKFGGLSVQQKIEKGQDRCTFKSAEMKKGDGRVEAWLEINGDDKVGVDYVYVTPSA